MYLTCTASPHDSNTRIDDDDLSDGADDDETKPTPAYRTCRLSKYKHTTERTSTPASYCRIAIL